MMANDRILENLSEKVDSYTFAMKNQLSFNRMVETQLKVRSFEQGKILGKPEDPIEGVKLVATRFGKLPVRSNWSYLLDPPFIAVDGGYSIEIHTQNTINMPQSQE